MSETGGDIKTILDFARAKREAQPIVMVTAYDALMARIVAEHADAILVGDSVAMAVHGFESTVHATLEMMALHTAAVRRGAPDTVVVADMPFGTCRQGPYVAAKAAETLMQAGATAVKLEGVRGHEDVISHLIGGGIPVMGHLGLTPQSVHQLGGYRVQARTEAEGARLRADAQRLEELGAFALVLECVPEALAQEVTAERQVPTIGIGAGRGTAGQILVLTDLLGLDGQFRPRFARRYLEGEALVREAMRSYAADVRAAAFPAKQEVLA